MTEKQIEINTNTNQAIRAGKIKMLQTQTIVTEKLNLEPMIPSNSSHYSGYFFAFKLKIQKKSLAFKEHSPRKNGSTF